AKVGKWVGLLQIELARPRLVLALDRSSEAKGAAITLVEEPVQHGDGSLEPVAVLDHPDGALLVPGGQVPVVAFRMRGCATNRLFEQVFRGVSAVHRFPHLVPGERGPRLDAGLTTFSPLDHALQSFEGVKPIALIRTISQPDGIGEFTSLRQ